MRLPWRRAAVERASWLADDTLLTIGWCVTSADRVEATLIGQDGARTLDARSMAYPRPDLHAPQGGGRVCVVRFPSEFDRQQAATLTVRSGGASWSVSTEELMKLAGSPRDVLAWGVGWLDAATRSEVLAFLCEPFAGQPVHTALQAAASLASAREILRPVLPERAIDRTGPCGVSLDLVLRLDERSFYLKGWACVVNTAVDRLRAISPEGVAVDLKNTAFRFRHDGVTEIYGDAVGRAGFIAYVRLPIPSAAADGWLVEIVGAGGLGCQSRACAVTAGTGSSVRETLLCDVEFDAEADRGLIERHIAPAMQRLHELDGDAPVVDTVVRYGMPPADPDVSIVVPLFKRLDLLEQQLAHFAVDPDMYRTDLIYVLDSPELADQLRDVAPELHMLYRIPFRVAYLARPAGFAGAINAGVSQAAGRLLLLLNSDVFPAGPGWIARMQAFYDATPRIGALGVKLLYEDDTLQHAGLYFRREREGALWENQHYYKGLERNFDPANLVRRVPGVTGACLMISKALYLEQGGLRGVYVQGDYEDSDLCLRLLTAGYDNWYLPDVELYHLEAQSYGWNDRWRASQFNAWTHTHLWSDAIATAMARFGS